MLFRSQMEEADRQFDAANAQLDAAEKLFPDDILIAVTRATVLGRMKREEEALAIIDGLAKRLPGGQLNPDHLQLKGRLLDAIGRYDEAYAAFAEGKRLLREAGGTRYLDAEAAEYIAHLKNFFVADRMKLLPRAAARTDVPAPIFVLGFPRSGTT